MDFTFIVTYEFVELRREGASMQKRWRIRSLLSRFYRDGFPVKLLLLSSKWVSRTHGLKSFFGLQIKLFRMLSWRILQTRSWQVDGFVRKGKENMSSENLWARRRLENASSLGSFSRSWFNSRSTHATEWIGRNFAHLKLCSGILVVHGVWRGRNLNSSDVHK